jgi:hypothetical protein
MKIADKIVKLVSPVVPVAKSKHLDTLSCLMVMSNQAVDIMLFFA